ncbi:hypothetical protein niasHS_005129 [Heterodera schachtii]|uniref:Uncharacterized protein n=1 Tax=Heterodera schachtii TaxID=97005 RepID=A0ABD2JTB6_HETSC
MQKTLNTIIQSAYDAKFPKEKRAKRETVDKELEPEIEPKPDKELTREVPPSIAKDIELTREASLPTAPDIELQREAEPKESDKEMGREIGPLHLSDKQLSELEGEKGQKQPPPPPIVEQQRKISAVDQDRLNLAKRVTEQSSNETVKLAATAADIAEKAKTALNRAEQALKQAPNAPDVKKWFDKLSNMENNLRELVEKISHESKKAAEVKRLLDVHYESKNLNECRKHADMAKQALKESKKYIAELTPMYFRIAPENQLGVSELSNRIVTAVDNFLSAKVTVPKPSEIPHYPAEQPKHQQEKHMENLKPTVEKEVQIPKLPDDEKVTKGHPPKATVEKELELEPVKSQDKELERESPKKADKELEPIVKQQSSKEDLLLEEIKNEMDQTELEREKGQPDIPSENTETEFPSLEYESEDSSEKQPEPAEEQVEVPYVPEKTEEKIEEEKAIFKEDTINEFPSTEYGIEDSDTDKTETGSPAQDKEKVLEEKDESLEQSDRQKEKAKILVISTDKKEEEFPSNEYDIEDEYASSSLTAAQNGKLASSAASEEDIPKPEDHDEDELPDLPDPLALSAKEKGDKKGATAVSDRVKMLMGHQKQQRKAVEFLFNEITQRFYIKIGTGVQHVDASSHLAYVLGFEGTRLYYNHPAKYLPDLSGGVRQLYVYAPKLVEDTIIGDRMAPLLRVVNVSGTGFIASQQAGRGEQQYFVGTRYQRGGGLLQNVARFLMPVASNLLSSASKEGIAAGTRVLGDLSQGKALKESLETHAKQGLENLAGKLQQCGKGKNYGGQGRRGQQWTKVQKYSDISANNHAIDRTVPIKRRRNKIIDHQYCDLSKTYMYLLTSIERKNAAGEWVPTDDAIEEDRHVGVEVFDSSIYYHYRAYIMQELGYSHEIRKAFHEAGCYYSDENSQDSYSNKGFTSRVQRFSNGKHCETMVKLNFDLARQNTLLLNNQDVVFTIHRNSDSFLLLTPRWKTVIDEVKDAQGNIVTAARVTWHDSKAEYRIRLHDMRLYLRTVDVTSSLNVAISRQLESTPAKYALRKVEMRSIFLGTGRTELSHNVFTSTLPRRLICAFVSTGAYSGARHLSPFNFEHANVRSISAEANGLTFPSTPYLFSFGNQKRFVRAFVDMYAGLGLDDSDNKTVSISMARFLSGWAFFVIPMTSTLDDTPGFELIRQGTCTVKVQFEQPIKADGYEMLILVARCSGVPYCEVLATLHSTRTVANLLVKGQIEPTACFEYNGKSYVFFEDRVADEMHIYCQLYALFKSEIDTQLSNYFPNPLQSVNCVHIVNTEYENQPVIVEGTLDLVDHLLFSTCYPKKRQGIEWSEPLYVELSDLMVCPGDLPKCLSHFGPQRERPKLMVDELDWHDSDDTADEAW